MMGGKKEGVEVKEHEMGPKPAAKRRRVDAKDSCLEGKGKQPLVCATQGCTKGGRGGVDGSYSGAALHVSTNGSGAQAAAQ